MAPKKAKGNRSKKKEKKVKEPEPEEVEVQVLARKDAFKEDELLRCVGEEMALDIIDSIIATSWEEIRRAQINEKAIGRSVEYCLYQMNQIVAMIPPPRGCLRRDNGDEVDTKLFAEIGKDGPITVPTDCWANSRVPHRPTAHDTHSKTLPKNVTPETSLRRGSTHSEEDMDFDAGHMYSRSPNKTRGKQFAIRRQGTQVMATPSTDDMKRIMEEQKLIKTFRILDAERAGSITVDKLFDFISMQAEEVRMSMQQLKIILLEDKCVKTGAKNKEIHGWSLIDEKNFVKFIQVQVEKNPSATFDVTPLGEEVYSNAEAAAELKAILKAKEEEAAKKKKKKLPRRDVDNKKVQSIESKDRENEKLPDFVQVVARWPRPKRNTDKRPATAMGFESSMSSIDKRFGRSAKRTDFSEDIYLQGSIIDSGVSVFSGVTLREVDKKASASKSNRTVNGLEWPEESPHMSRAKYERLRRGLPDTEPIETPLGKEASMVSEKSGGTVPVPENSLVISPEAEELVKSMSTSALDPPAGLDGCSEKGSQNYSFGDRVNVTSNKWLLDENQQEILNSILRSEEEVIGEVRGVTSGNEITVSTIPSARARLARPTQKAALKTNRRRPASSGGRRPRSSRLTVRERFGSLSGTGF